MKFLTYFKSNYRYTPTLHAKEINFMTALGRNGLEFWMGYLGNEEARKCNVKEKCNNWEVSLLISPAVYHAYSISTERQERIPQRVFFGLFP